MPEEPGDLQRQRKTWVIAPGLDGIDGLTPALRNVGLEWAALLGPGCFEFRRGTNVVASPPGGAERGSGSSLGSNGWTARTDSPEAVLLAVLSGPPTGGGLMPGWDPDLRRFVVRLRRTSGTLQTAAGTDGAGIFDGVRVRRLIRLDLPKIPFGESVTLDGFLVPPLPMRFVFAAPGR
ncbi:MAG: hypothetical protein J0L84_14605 [Verrucomicrobia bacterium]|nr:hypothetical protein [Verrucomicrobiota bacterium]